MKKKVLCTISLCAAICACAGSAFGGAAYADEPSAETFYPETFAASEICDYAVNGNTFAFATNEKIAVFRKNGTPEYFDNLAGKVTALDCADGVFYYKLSDESVHSLDGQVSAHKMSQTELPFAVKGYSYGLKKDGTISVWDGENDPTAIEGNFSNLKVFDGVVYAVDLDKTRLNKITPPNTVEEIEFEVADFSATKKIPAGNTLNALKQYNLDKPHFTTLKDNEYLTEVKLDELTATSQFLSVDNTFKVGEDAKFIAGQTALLLCKTGNADVIALGGACYIKLADDSATTRDFSTPEYSEATVCVPFDYAYSSPFANDATQLFKINWGDKVTVLGKISAPELREEFYKVSNENGDIGYVPCGFVVSEAASGDEYKTRDPDYSEADMVKTVVLVILVVVLVLCAAGYVAYILTAGRKKSASAKADGKPKDE